MEYLTLGFRECEHDGDLECYASDVEQCLVKSGGKIYSTDINYEAELGEIELRFEDKEQKKVFIGLFKETSAYDFIN